jgi:hypothetical protein
MISLSSSSKLRIAVVILAEITARKWQEIGAVIHDFKISPTPLARTPPRQHNAGCLGIICHAWSNSSLNSSTPGGFLVAVSKWNRPKIFQNDSIIAIILYGLLEH